MSAAFDLLARIAAEPRRVAAPFDGHAIGANRPATLIPDHNPAVPELGRSISVYFDDAEAGEEEFDAMAEMIASEWISAGGRAYGLFDPAVGRLVEILAGVGDAGEPDGRGVGGLPCSLFHFESVQARVKFASASITAGAEHYEDEDPDGILIPAGLIRAVITAARQYERQEAREG